MDIFEQAIEVASAAGAGNLTQKVHPLHLMRVAEMKRRLAERLLSEAVALEQMALEQVEYGHDPRKEAA